MTWLFTGNEGVAFAIAGAVGGALSGMMLMFYRDISARGVTSASQKLGLGWVSDGQRRLVFRESMADLQSAFHRIALERSVENEEKKEEKVGLANRDAYAKATLFALGIIILGLTAMLIPLSGFGFSQASWVLAGLGLGAAFEHSVWLFAEASEDRDIVEEIDVGFTEVGGESGPAEKIQALITSGKAESSQS